MWGVFIASAVGLIGSIVYAALQFYRILPYIWLLSSITFFIGSLLFLYTSYPENYGSTVFFDAMTCSHSDIFVKRPDQLDPSLAIAGNPDRRDATVDRNEYQQEPEEEKMPLL
jgi:hypothetical protein